MPDTNEVNFKIALVNGFWLKLNSTSGKLPVVNGS